MRTLLTMIGGLAVMSGCGPRETVPVPGDPSSAPAASRGTSGNSAALFSGRGIECLRVGMPVTAMHTECFLVSDTTVPGMEGMMERQLRVTIGGDTVIATVSHDTVRRLVIMNPRFHTSDSLGVGAELDRLLAVPGATALEGEGRLFVTVPTHCGLSFRLAAKRAPGQNASTDVLVRTVLQRNTPVDQVLVFGCDR